MTVGVLGAKPNRIRIQGKDAHNASVFRALVEFGTELLEREGPDLVVTGLDLGWQQAMATACVETGVPWIAALPFEGEEYIWPTLARKRYLWLLNQAEHVRIVSPGGYAPGKRKERDRWIIAQADQVWDLSEPAQQDEPASEASYTKLWLPWKEWVSTKQYTQNGG